MRSPTRRDTLRLLGGGALAGLGLPRLARAGVVAGDRRFLFIFVDGGWDPVWALAPVFDNPYVDMPEDGAKAEAGGHAWVSAPSRPSVDSFFQTYGARTAVIHGIEIPSIAHERCKRLLLTGGASSGVNDFPTNIAAGSPEHLALAHVVLTGPVYTDGGANNVVRLGVSSQVYGLVEGSCMEGTSPPLDLPADEITALEDAFLQSRAAAAAGAAGRGAASRIASAYQGALTDVEGLPAIADRLIVHGENTLDQLVTAADLLGDGLARCAIVADKGQDNQRWDHHSEITRQGPSFEQLMGNLNDLLGRMSSTSGSSGGSLLDEITVVVCSEMGRYPSLNSSYGKDHWMTTSMMLIGGGIRGGQVVGAYDANMGSTPVIPETGELDPDGRLGGVVLGPGHIGATLLALAGLDPAETLGAETSPIEALIDP